MKYLIFDAGPIISLTMSGMLYILKNLKKEFKGEFIITPAVYKEVVEKPLKIKKYRLEAVQVQELINEGILTLTKGIIPRNKLEQETNKILKTTNGILRSKRTGEKISIIHEGEASCLALANLLKEESMIVIDERTTRLLSEAPGNLRELMEKKLHTELEANIQLLETLKNYKFIRSSELLYIAHKKKLTGLPQTKQTLDALLYGVKYKGTAISTTEIEELKNIA